MATDSTYSATLQNRTDQLILDHVDYVGRILSTLETGPVDRRSDLHSAGLLGLVEAANRFKPELGVPFRTFAYPRIRGAIVDELRRESRVSQQVFDQIRMIRNAQQVLEPPATPERIAHFSGLTIEQVLNGMDAMRFMAPEAWNDLSDILDSNARSPLSENATENQELLQLVGDCIENLPEQERIVLTLYYTDELKLAEIGRVLDLSESRVSRILTAAKYRLKEQVLCKTR